MTLRLLRIAPLTALAFASTMLVTACGSKETADEQQGEAAAVPAAPGTVQEGTELESADYVGLEDGNVTFHLHWVGGPIAKDAAPGAQPPKLEAVRTAAGANFDRVMFRFAGSALPGYQLSWVTSPPETCARQSAAPEGTRHLRLRLRPVDTSGSVRPELADGHGNLRGVAQTCAEDGQLEWHFGVADSAQVRVLEMGGPPRLVVDVRQGPVRVLGTTTIP
jgi:hypothetical protein